VAFNLQPRRTGQMLLGSSRQAGIASRAVEPRMIAALIERARGFLPGLGNLRALRCWTGLRAASEDQLPLIGPLPGLPSVLLAAGHEGLGITMALATARLLLDHVLQRPAAIDPTPYLPGRPSPLAHQP
jgi:glycine/D-amino acid oxidase-like deaminating enzyme